MRFRAALGIVRRRVLLSRELKAATVDVADSSLLARALAAFTVDGLGLRWQRGHIFPLAADTPDAYLNAVALM